MTPEFIIGRTSASPAGWKYRVLDRAGRRLGDFDSLDGALNFCLFDDLRPVTIQFDLQKSRDFE